MVSLNPRLLWAEAMDDERTAIVIESYGQMFGGVAVLCDLSLQTTYQSWTVAELQMKFRFIWFQVVESPEEFRGSARWKQEQEQATLRRLQTELPPFYPPEDLKRQLEASPSFQQAKRYLADSRAKATGIKLIEHKKEE